MIPRFCSGTAVESLRVTTLSDLLGMLMIGNDRHVFSQ